MDDLLAARFPALARDAGGYESYYLWEFRFESSEAPRAPACAVYELGMRERDHGMEIQRYPDG